MVFDAQQDANFTSKLITQLFRLSQHLALFLVAYRLMMVESVAKRSLLIFSLSCVLLAILQVSGVVAAEIGSIGQGRSSTSFGDDPNKLYDPNKLASMLSIGLLGLVGFAYARQDMDIKLRAVAWISSGFLLTVIIRSGSRGAQLALALALVVLMVRPASIPHKIKTGHHRSYGDSALGLGIYKIDVVRERWEKTYYDKEVASRDLLCGRVGDVYGATDSWMGPTEPLF